MTLIPDAKTKDYFELDKDNKIISALPSITNADVTMQSLMNGSLDDVDMQSTFKETGILLRLILIQTKDLTLLKIMLKLMVFG